MRAKAAAAAAADSPPGSSTAEAENIGRVLAKLKDAGLEQNTLVAFVSDNGPAVGKPAVKV